MPWTSAPSQEKGFVAETIRAPEIDAAYDRMQKSDVKYRFVIDNASMAE